MIKIQPSSAQINRASDPHFRLCVEKIIDRLETRKQPLTNRELLELCAGTNHIFGEEIDPHFYHEIAEAALNLLILQKYAGTLKSMNDPEGFVIDVLKPLCSQLPTQTWRSSRQIAWQQFSTPPPIAFLLVWMLNLGKREWVILEPSAGTGNLAVWTKGAGLTTHTNEIDLRRRLLLEHLGFSATTFNAEFIDDFLPREIAPSCILMNPPFSSNGGRTKNNSSKYGFRHVRSALDRLENGGRFGIILGEAGGLDTKTGKEFWNSLAATINVKTIIKINGREYAKNGTTVDVNLIVGQKLSEPSKTDKGSRLSQIPVHSVKTIEEAFDKVETRRLRLN